MNVLKMKHRDLKGMPPDPDMGICLSPKRINAKSSD